MIDLYPLDPLNVCGVLFIVACAVYIRAHIRKVGPQIRADWLYLTK